MDGQHDVEDDQVVIADARFVNCLFSIGRHIDGEGLFRQPFGQHPRGIFGADELIRSGQVDPRQAFETCGVPEFNKYFKIDYETQFEKTFLPIVEDLFALLGWEEITYEENMLDDILS